MSDKVTTKATIDAVDIWEAAERTPAAGEKHSKCDWILNRKRIVLVNEGTYEVTFEWMQN